MRAGYFKYFKPKNTGEVLTLDKYSFGVGDRFGLEGVAQLKAIGKLKDMGITVTPVWNKSHREHQIIKTTPQSVRKEADDAVKEMEWKESYFVDADHITMDTIDAFLDSSDFFTIDVAEFIGQAAGSDEIQKFVKKNSHFIGNLKINGIDEPFKVSDELLENVATNYLQAILQARLIYTYIRENKGNNAAVEISMDEVETPQTPIELFFILKSLSDYGVQINTIAPKFTGRFNKGVDYVGSMDKFAEEFEQDILVIKKIVSEYNLPSDLKLSVHSGSDKFSLYKPINKIIKKQNAGLHLKTSGTTWLEELIGLAMADGDGLNMVKSIYDEAWHRFEELTGPYESVIDIDYDSLPSPEFFNKLDSNQVVAKIRHNQQNNGFDPQLRQFFHCSYKIAAEFGTSFTDLIKNHSDVIHTNVTGNLFDRHLRPLFLAP